MKSVSSVRIAASHTWLHRCQSVLALLALSSFAIVKAATTPAVNLVTAPLVTPANAWTYYGSATTHTIGLAAWSTTPPEIQAMATSLGAARYAAGTITAAEYSQYVYDYVRNSIAVEFRFGLGKGGRGALIDQSGTAFDQAELMVKLLRVAGITAGYQVGTITLTAQQFGVWSNFVTGLNQSAQTFTINAQAACQFLADGGIPATINSATSCTSLTGNLTTVTLGHIWVSANGLLYDPAYKQSTLYLGVDIAAAMGCGTASAPTCGATAETAAMSGAIQSTLAGSPTIQKLNETLLQTQLQSYAVNLENYIKTNLVAPASPYPRLQNVIGGYLRNTSYDPVPAATLPYTSATQYTWSGDIPDQFRSVVQLAYSDATITLYGDEIAGRGVTFYNDETNFRLRVDSLDTIESPYPGTNTGPGGSFPVFNLVVNHPYAANGGSYGDETVDFTSSSAGTGELPIGAGNSASIIVSFGDSSASTASHFADLQQSYLASYADCTTPVATAAWLWRCELFTDQHMSTVSNLLSQISAADQVITNVGATLTTRHHSIGLAFSGPSLLSLDSAVSANSVTDNATSRQSAYTALATVDAMLEGSVYQQERDTPEGDYAAALFHRSNVDGASFVDITSANMAAVLPSLTNYSSARQAQLSARAAAGYELIVPQSGITSCAFPSPDTVATCTRYGGDYATTATSTALLIAEVFKGGGGFTGSEFEDAIVNTTKRGEYSLFQKKYSSVDAATGTLTLSPPPDVVAGAGEFPDSLPFTRSYSSAGRVGGWLIEQEKGNGSDFPADNGYQGPDTFVNARLGGAWTHNYEIAAEITNDGREALGEHGSLPAAAAIAAIFSLYDIGKTVDFPHKLTSLLTSFWLGSNYLTGHTVLVHKGSGTESFQKLPDNSFTALKVSKATLVQTGAVSGVNLYSQSNSITWGRNYYQPVQFVYTDGDGAVLSFNQCLQRTSATSNWCNGVIPISTWAFPTGVTLQFTYPTVALQTCTTPSGNSYSCGGGVTTLTKVSNNLGRSLTFALTADPVSISSFSQISSVTTDSGQVASYANTGCTTTYFQTPLCNFFSVTTPDGATTQYGYAAGADSPDPTIAYPSQNYRLRRVFFPTTPITATYVFAYDGKGRLSTVTDSLGNQTTYDPGGLYAEQWRRADVIDPTGSVSTSYFDDAASLLASIDGDGRTTSYTYDLSRRKLTTTYPELNHDAYSYDVRSNLLSTTRYPVPGGSSWSPITTYTAYNEAPTVVMCVYAATCNKPATTTDSLSNVTTYTYLSSGQTQRVVGPAVTAQTGGTAGSAQTDLCYTATAAASGTVSLLTGSIEKVTASVNRVKTYGYDTAANHLSLLSITADPATSWVPPATAGGGCTTTTKSSPLALQTSISYDANGNIASTTNPRLYKTSFNFDAMRRLTTISAPLSALTRYCYTADGLFASSNQARATTTDPNASTASTSGLCPVAYPTASWQSESRNYFSNGELENTTDANGNVTVYAYDAAGRQQVVQDGDGRQTATLYDPAGQVLYTWKGGSGWITSAGLPSGTWPSSWVPSSYADPGPLRYAAYTYTLNGKPLSITDAGGTTTNRSYDGFDRLTSTVYADATHEDQWYTLDGTTGTARCSASDQPCRKITRSANYIDYRYDAADRKVTRTPQLEGGYTYGYNLIGEPSATYKLALGSVPGHSTLIGYDAAGRESSETNDGRQVSYLLDGADNLTQLTWPDGYQVTYQYDALNRMTYALENGTTELAYYSYDTLSRRNYVCLGGQSSSCIAGGGTNKTSYTYEPDSDLSTLTQTLNSANVTLSYGHNHSHQITALGSSDSFYLPIPVAFNTSYSIGLVNEYSSVAGNSLVNTPNGNLQTLFPSSGAQTYQYDSENRLINAGVAGSSIPSIFYDYDALERRVTKTIGGTSLATGGTTTNYLLDGSREIAELDGSGNVLRRYVPGALTDEKIIVAEGSSLTAPTRTYFHVNHQGSIMEMTDAAGNDGTTDACAAGVNCLRLAYDEYGNLSPSSPASGVPYRYTGQRYDPETGLYYYRARYYSAQIGRFMQTDPIGYKSDLNFYAYVGNDPLNKTDPNGTFSFPWHFGITFAASLSTGHSFTQSLKLAWSALWTDFRPHSQDKTVEATAQHGMRIRGESVEQARQENAKTISREMDEGDRGGAAHGIQDPFAAGHEGYQEWSGWGGLGLWGSLKHIFEDTFPTPTRVSDAYHATVDLFNGANNGDSGNAPQAEPSTAPSNTAPSSDTRSSTDSDPNRHAGFSFGSLSGDGITGDDMRWNPP